MKDKDITIGVFANHEEAIKAIKALQSEDFDIENISLVGKGTIVEDHVHAYTGEDAIKASASTGAVLGSTLGLMTGLGVLAIPGLGALFLAGAVTGAVAGFSIGTATGGLVGIFAAMGVGKEGALRYEKHLKEGKYLVALHGTKAEAEKAKGLIAKHPEVHAVETLNK